MNAANSPRATTAATRRTITKHVAHKVIWYQRGHWAAPVKSDSWFMNITHVHKEHLRVHLLPQLIAGWEMLWLFMVSFLLPILVSKTYVSHCHNDWWNWQKKVFINMHRIEELRLWKELINGLQVHRELIFDRWGCWSILLSCSEESLTAIIWGFRQWFPLLFLEIPRN